VGILSASLCQVFIEVSYLSSTAINRSAHLIQQFPVQRIGWTIAIGEQSFLTHAFNLKQLL
jgi:hypothetical protein